MKKKIISLFLAVIMIAGMLPLAAIPVFAGSGQEPIPYLVCIDGIHQIWETRYCTNYTIISNDNKPTEWESGWYVCDGATYDYNDNKNRIEIDGDVHLILKNNTELSVKEGIELTSGNSLTVYEQPNWKNAGKRGRILAYNHMTDHAAIGSNGGDDCGDIILHGGIINADSLGDAAAIGGGFGYYTGGDGGNITVYGGILNAEAVEGDGAGIGGGSHSVLAGNGGSLTVYGGSVNAFSRGNGAAIGGGGVFGMISESIAFEGGDGGKVKIYGGKIAAHSYGNGAGIGGGNGGGDGGSIEIYGGEVAARSDGNGAAIGGGEDGDTFDSTDNVFGLYGGSLHAYNTGSSVAFGPGVGGDDEDGTVTVAYDCAWINALTGERLGFNSDRKAILGQKEFWLENNAGEYPVSYQSVTENRIIENKVCDNYRVAYYDDPAWDNGWYVIDGKGTSDHPVTVTGDVHLILANGCDVTINGGIVITEGSTLTVHRQTYVEGLPEGKLTAAGSGGRAGIFGNMVLCGGDVTARGDSGAVGFGGNLALYGGSIAAYGGNGAVAIGGGYNAWGGELKLYRGNVTAVAGSGALRAIGARTGSSTNCTILLGDSTVLLDPVSGQPIEYSHSALAWNDVLNGSTVSFTAASETSYRKYSDQTEYFDTKICLEYTPISIDNTNWTNGWYVQNQNNMTFTQQIKVTGDVCLILSDDSTVDFNGGILIEDGSSLTVYAQSEGANKGRMNVACTDGVAVKGDLVIAGGSVSLAGGVDFAAIDGNLTIEGGSFCATAGEGASRAIEGSVTVGEPFTLLDATGKTIQKPGSASWGEVLGGSSVSFSTVITETYLEYSADGKSCEEKKCTDYHLIDGSFKTLNTGWYLVHGTMTIDGSLTVNGDVKLILANGCKLTVEGGICVNKNNSLTIYAQSEGEKAGELIANGKKHCAGIGGSWKNYSGKITIHGGNIISKGGNATDSNNLPMLGGGAGIGGGEGGDCTLIVIYGGSITAIGGTYSAGIGGGYSGGYMGTVTIYGGYVKAIGGANNNSLGGGAGIGGGASAGSGTDTITIGDTVTVYDGYVEAIGGFGAAGIGGGWSGAAYDSLNIFGGTVKATGGDGAVAIGNGTYCETSDGSIGIVNFSGGTLIATGSGKGGPIGASQQAIENGEVNIDDTVLLINNSNGKLIVREEEKTWLETLNAASDHSSGNYVLSITLLNSSGEQAPTCTESGHKAYYYSPHSDLYYQDTGCQIEIGGIEALLIWLEDENGGLLPASGHKDENKDNFCDVCYNNICEHIRCSDSYSWSSDYTECTATRHCNDCECDILIEKATEILLCEEHIGENCLDMGYGYYTASFVDFAQCASGTIDTQPGPHNGTATVAYEWSDDYRSCTAKKICDACKRIIHTETASYVEFTNNTPGIDCCTKGKGYYQAIFGTLGNTKTESIFDTEEYGPHHYVDGYCKDCTSEQPLAGAKEDAIAAINAAADDSTDFSVILVVNGAKALITNAQNVSEIIEIRNKCITNIELISGIAHEHTYSENWSLDPYYHWHDSICEHDVVSGFGAHTFGEGVTEGNKTTYTCSECGYKKFVYDTAGDNEGEIISGISYTGISLTLGSDIAINFYMDLTEEARQNGTMTFDIGGRIVTGIKVRKNENGYYFSTPLTALEMAETVTATFTYNGVEYVQKYSVADYIDTVVGNPGKYGTEAVALARKIANYGYYAQIYLESIHTNVHIVDSGDGYDRMEPFGGEFDIDVAKATEALANYVVNVTGTSDNLSLYGSTVYFDSATALNYYVTVKNGEKPTATAVNTVTGETKQVEIKLYKDNIYIVSVKDITATELADDISVTINGELTLTGSVFAYCNSVIAAHSFDGATDKDIFAVNAMAAFYEYYEAAMEYISFDLHFDMPEHYKVFTADGEEITGDTTLKCYRTFSFRLVPDDKYIISMVNVEGLREPDENGLYTVSFTGGKHNVVVYTELDTYRLTVNVEGEDGGEMPDTKILFVYDSHESIEAQCWGPGIYKMDVPKGKSGTIVITKSGYQEYSQEFTADGTVEEISVSLVPDSFSVTFDMMGHGEQISSQTVEKGGKITKPTTPTADDKEFAGWFKDENRTVKWNFDTDTVTADTTLYAKWREKTDYSQYSLCGEINGEYYGIDFSTIYPHDAPYMFSSDGKLTVTISRTTAVKLRTLVAEYWYYFEDTAPDGTARKLHQTTFNNRGNGHSMVVKGRQVTFTLSKDEDGALMLGYEILPCTVSFNMMGHGSQIPSQTVKYEEYAQKPADPTEEGYIFDGWFMDETCTEPYDWDYWFVTEDITLYAKWTEYTSSLADGYYLVGTLNGVNFLDVSSLTSDMKLAPSSIYDEYKLDWTFYANDEIKIVKIVGDKITVWYNNDGEYYKIGESNAGEGTLYFRPEGNAEWSYFYLTVTS